MDFSIIKLELVIGQFVCARSVNNVQNLYCLRACEIMEVNQ